MPASPRLESSKLKSLSVAREGEKVEGSAGMARVKEKLAMKVETRIVYSDVLGIIKSM